MSYAACIISVIAMAFSALIIFWMKRKFPLDREGLKEAAANIKKGSERVIAQELIYRIPVMAVIFLILFFFVGNVTAVLFLVGTLMSFLAMVTAIVMEDVGTIRASEAANTEITEAYRLIYRTAMAMGIGIAGLGLLVMVLIYWALGIPTLVSAMAGFGLGISANALLGRIGDRAFSGVFDLLETYACSVIAAMTLAYMAVQDAGVSAFFTERMAVVFPLTVIGAGLAVTILADLSFRVKTDENESIRSMNRRMYLTAAVTAVIGGILCIRCLGSVYYLEALLSGIIAGVLAEVFSAAVNRRYNVVSEMRPASEEMFDLMRRRLSAGMVLNILLVLLTAVAVYISYRFAGAYGVALAAAGMAAVSGMKMTEGAFLSVSYGVATLQEITGTPRSIMTGKASNLLQNGAAAIRGGGSAVVTAALASLAMMLSFANYADLDQMDMLSPDVLTCGLLGIVIPFLYSGLEARSGRTLNTDTLMASTWKKGAADGGVLHGIFEEGRVRNLIFPGILTMLIPVAAGFLFGAEALCAMLASSVFASIMMSVICSNSSRRYALVSGTSVNILMKSMAVVSLALVSVFGSGIL